MKAAGRTWPRYLMLGLTAEQDEYLGTLGKARRKALQETTIGRVGKADRSAIVRALIVGAMEGRRPGKGPELPMPSAAALLAASTEAPPPVMVSLTDMHPGMARELSVADIPRVLELLHELLAAVWRRAQTHSMGLQEAAPQIAAQRKPQWIGGAQA